MGRRRYVYTPPEPKIEQPSLAQTYTFGFIKPDAYDKRYEILAYVEKKGKEITDSFKIPYGKSHYFTRKEAEGFYWVHSGRPFFSPLVEFASSGPSYMFLATTTFESLPSNVYCDPRHAVRVLRSVMGATDPGKAAPGTVRALHGETVERNAMHASDSPETVRFELPFFFSWAELQSFDLY